MKLRYLMALACAALLLAPSALAAGGAAGSGYGGSAGNVQNEVGSGNAAGAAGASGSLPFTGLDLALLVVGGAALLLVGTGMRRAARRGT